MKSLLLLHCYLFLIGYSLAANIGECNIAGIEDQDYVAGYSLNINDTQIGVNILERAYTGNLVIEQCTTTDSQYFVVTKDDTNFIIQTTAEFANLDENTSKQSNIVYFVNVECTLTCVGSSLLPIQIVVTDINTHAPVFSRDNYEYRIATPLMPLTDFTIYGDTGISVTDIDFSNQQITFTVDPDDFAITALTTSTSKQYTAVFSTRNVIQLIGSRTYTITATDSGTIPGPLSTATSFTLTVDESKSLDTPLFDSSSYTFNYTVDGSTPSLTPNDGPILVSTNKPTLMVNPTLTGTYEDYFTATLDQSTGTITFDVNKILPTDTGSFLILTLSVSTDNSASTSIVVYLPEVNDAPVFSSHYYVGSYNDIDSSVTLQDLITITSSRTPNVTITGDYADHFKITYSQETTVCQVSVSTDLSGSEITSQSYINLILTATVGDNFDTAVLVLSLPNYKLQFTETLYNAAYNKNATVTVDDAIDFTTSTTGVNITMHGTYADNFDIKYTSESKQWSIVVNQPLSDTILKTQEDIVVTLTATDYYGNTAQSVIRIYLPSTIGPTFSEVYYVANYTAHGNSPTIILDKDIVIDNIESETNVKVIFDSFTENFSIDYDSTEKKWNLILKAPLSDSTLASKQEIIIKLTAEEENNDNKGQGLLIITWSTLEAPEFSEAYYLGTYPENETGTIALKTPISFSNIEDPTNVDISLDSYTENFDIAYSSNVWTITIIKSLGESVLTKNSELVIVLTAKETGNENEGQAVLVVDLPLDKRAPKFVEAYYLAQYPENGTGIIEFEHPISFTNVDDPTTIEIILDNYSNNFEITYGNNRWFINIKSSLIDSILNENAELVLTMIATQTGNQIEDHAVLLLKLSDDEAAPRFSEAYYVAEYPESGTGTIELENAITFLNINDPSTVTIILDNYGNNFEVLYDSKTWSITITTSLEQTILQRNTELVMTLVASKAGIVSTGKATLVLKLPTAVNGTAPKFLEAYYIANYPQNGTGIIEFENPIQFINVDDPTGITINLDKYAANFEVISTSNRWFINIIKSLEETVLHQNVELIMTLIANEQRSNSEGESALVLRLPTASNGTAPRFSKPYYLATYPETGTGDIEFETPVAFLNVEDTTKVTINLDNYGNNFDVVYESNRWYISIKNSLDQDILKANKELVITLIAIEDGNENDGEAALVLKLPSANATAPKFSKAYYTATYPETGTGDIEFETPVTFLNVEDQTKVAINLDNYTNNFDVLYKSNNWYISIKNSLDLNMLQGSTELVMTLIAIQDGNPNDAESALILKLPTSVNRTAPKFSEAYYISDYPATGTGVIEFEIPIEFLNVDDPKTVAITLDSYSNNFDIKYESNRWYINITDSIEETTLHKNAELVMTLIATENGNENIGESALVMKLPTAANGTAPRFSEAYYISEYPANGSGIIEFETPIEFTNVDASTSITISLDNYENYFEVKYDNNRWYINIIKQLEEAVLKGNIELVMTLIASESGNENKGESALVLNLPSVSNDTTPKFLEAYYLADYPETGSGIIEFENPIQFTNVDDQTTLTIDLDNYLNNFEITYVSNKWVINIKDKLDDNVLTENTELVMTLIATVTGDDNKGQSALVLKLPTSTNATAPQFTEAYYLADYPETETGIIEFENHISFINVDDPTSLTINLDNYGDYFEIKYETSRWYINIIKSLEKAELYKNSELVITLIATEIGNTVEGKSALVLKLPTAANGTAPKFSEAYYIAAYPQFGTGNIEFEKPIEFTNVDDPTSVTITLSNYSSNFDVKYENSRWYISIKSGLEETILNKNAEIVMALTATETGNDNAGYSALVLKLPASANVTGPKFSEVYYIADYPKSGDGSLVLENQIELLNVDDPTTITIALDNYLENFEVVYESDSWHINIKSSLENGILNKNAELVMKLIATETENKKEAYSVLVVRLPSIVNETAPEFRQAYYIAEYPENPTESIEFESPIGFLNVDDLSTVTITLDNYTNNFEITYTLNKWSIHVKNALGEDILNNYSELIMTLAATNTDSIKEGYSALILKLPSGISKTSPVFSEAYYLADYTGNTADTIEFENPISFKNVNEPSKVTINLDSYTDYFEIDLNSGKWVINVKKPLEDHVLNENNEIVITLIATETDKPNEGYSALVLKVSKEVAPVFSEPYYVATYRFNDGQASVVFTDLINITNKQDLSNIYITVDDNYQENFKIVYNSDSNTWVMNVLKQISDSILISNTDIVVALTATDSNSNLSGRSVIDLKLPSLNTEEAPKFSKTYYTAKYTISGGTALVTFDTPLNITNREDLTDISIGMDNYAENFIISYDGSGNEWKMNVAKNLDESILNGKIDLVMALTASETDSDEIAQAALVLTLPIVNNEEAPKFSRIYYSGAYSSDDGGTVYLDNSIEITNKNYLPKITISFDDNYKDNFEIVYDSASSLWTLNTKNPLTESALSNNTDLILTLTATEEDNTNIGQAALILHLPAKETKLPPKFSLAHYSGEYVVDADKASINLHDIITIVNKEDFTAISVSLDSYNSNFKINYDSSSKRWSMSVTELLVEDILNTTSELILTLIASETNNGNIGESILILSLPSANNNSTEGALKFSQVHYTADYSAVENSLVLIDTIKVISTVDTTKLTVAFERNEDSDHFTITPEGDGYTVSVHTPLPSEILDTEISLVLTLVAAVDENRSFATLVINLPTTVADLTIEFSATLYSGKYEVVDGRGSFEINGPISVKTDETDSNVEKSISSTNGYENYFQISYSNNLVSVALTGDLPETILSQNSFIPLVLTVGIRGTTTTSSAVLNVEINYNMEENSTAIGFSNVLYNGEYNNVDGHLTLVIYEIITVVTEEPDSNIEVALTNTNGYQEYFQESYRDNTVTLTVIKDIPENVLRQNFIPLIITANIRGTSKKSSAVVNVALNYNGGVSDTSIEFSNVLYNAKYEITDGDVTMTLLDQITLVTNAEDSKIEVSIANEYQTYFNVTRSQKRVMVYPTNLLTAEILNSTSVVPLMLQAGITDTSSRASAVLNTRIIYEDDETKGLVQFGSVLYTGEYSEDTDGNAKLKLNEVINVITDRTDDEIQAKISNDFIYNGYFDVSYSTNIVSVVLLARLPTEVVKNNTFIILKLTVGIKDTSVTSSAVLNIEIDKDDNNNDGPCKVDQSETVYIAVIATLAVLLAACIAGAVAFYYLKIRNRRYENLDEEGNGRVRFDKNSLKRTSYENKLNPVEGRRPTGFVFNPIGDDHVEAINNINNIPNTDSPNDVEKTRRKSVAFDDNVEKLQIDSLNDEDIVSDDSLNDKPEITHV